MKEKIMEKTAGLVNKVANMGGGPICLGWTYQPQRPKCTIKNDSDKSKK